MAAAMPLSNGASGCRTAPSVLAISESPYLYPFIEGSHVLGLACRWAPCCGSTCD
jgi:hypothetical protein